MQANTTPVPNALFDIFLKGLQIAELKVLLVILRQTLGWRDVNSKLGRKEMDWISSNQFQDKTGCSRRAISSAIQSLITKHLIEVLDQEGIVLYDAVKRQGKSRLFYRPTFVLTKPVENQLISGSKREISGSTYANFAEDLRKKRTTLAQKMRITKETLQN